MCSMLLNMSASKDEDEISKTAAKRKFLLTDEDLDAVPFKLKPNPMNKGYAPMKVYDKSSLEKIAVEKHGNLEEIQAKLSRKSDEAKSRMESKNEETRNLWDCEEVYEPMKQFMNDIDLPVEKKSQYFEKKKQASDDSEDTDKQILIEGNSDADLLTNDIIIHYFDCMHNRAKGAGSYAVHRKFPSAAKADQETPYNDRKKLGHFCWLETESNQLVIILYVTHKFPRLAPNRPVVPVMDYDALQLGLKRLSNLLEKKLEQADRTKSSLSVGTYLPYKADQAKFTEVYNKTFTIPVQLHTRFHESKT